MVIEPLTGFDSPFCSSLNYVATQPESGRSFGLVMSRRLAKPTHQLPLGCPSMGEFQKGSQTIGAWKSILAVFFNPSHFKDVDLLPQHSSFAVADFMAHLVVPLADQQTGDVRDCILIIQNVMQ
jgi:hypothetical protein